MSEKVEIKYKDERALVEPNPELLKYFKDEYGFYEGQKLYYIHFFYNIVSEPYAPNRIDSRTKAMLGRYFETYELAFRERRKIMLLVKIKNFIRTIGGTLTIEDWKDSNKPKFALCYDFNEGVFDIINSYSINSVMNIYFNSRDAGLRTVERFGIELKSEIENGNFL